MTVRQSVRRWLGVAVAVAYVGVCAWAATGSQCPVAPDSGCARVHALMLGAPPSVPSLDLAALPMHAAGTEPGQPTAPLIRLAALR